MFGTVKSHVNYVVMDSDWEAVAAKTLDEIPEVISYVKNQFLGFAIPYVRDGAERQYFPDFIARIAVKGGETPVNLIIEVKGYRREDAKEKRSTMETYWIPAVNNIGTFGRWAFAELTQPYTFEIDMGKQIEEAFRMMIEEVATDNSAGVRPGSAELQLGNGGKVPTY